MPSARKSAASTKACPNSQLTMIDEEESKFLDEPEATDNLEVILIEPFYGGSHKQLIDILISNILQAGNVQYQLHTLPPRKWHWRFMASSFHFAQEIKLDTGFTRRKLFATSMVNLAELVGFQPHLASPTVEKILYFHENQLTYPLQEEVAGQKVAAQDFQIGWSQIMSCMVADTIVFNSDFNRTSFLRSVQPFLNKIPEQQLRPSGSIEATIRSKSRVLYFPIFLPAPDSSTWNAESRDITDKPLRIVWNHRWEHDKNPTQFFRVVEELAQFLLKKSNPDTQTSSLPQRIDLIVLGESYPESPKIFKEAFEALSGFASVQICHWGYAASKEEYFRILRDSDVVVSNSLHEFYGVSMLEATLCGCFPLLPNRLVYPELYPKQCLYNTERQLFKRLKSYCLRPSLARRDAQSVCQSFQKHTWTALEQEYRELLVEPKTTI